MALGLGDKFKYTQISDQIAKDPLSSETEKKKRNLFVVSGVCLLVTVFEISTKISFLDYCDSAVVGKNLNPIGIMGLVLLYSYFSFAYHAFIDFERWYLLKDLLSFQDALSSIESISSGVRSLLSSSIPNLNEKLDRVSERRELLNVAIQRYEERGGIHVIRNIDGFVDNIGTSMDSYKQILPELTANLRDVGTHAHNFKFWIEKFQVQYGVFNLSNLIRILLFDVLLPFSLGTYAIVKVSPYLKPVYDVVLEDLSGYYSYIQGLLRF